MKIYEDDVQSRHLLRSFMALALLLVEFITCRFELLKKRVKDSAKSEQLKVFVEYFENEWLHHFKPSLWSVCESNWRTNNVAEGKTYPIITLMRILFLQRFIFKY